MVSKVKSIGLSGLDGFVVEAETDIRRSDQAGISIVGLPDTAVRESRNRIKTALSNSGYDFPDCQIILNLAPADVKKEGASFDLPIVAGILAAAEKIPQPEEKTAFIGEVSLSGGLRNSSGVLALVITAKNLGFEEIYIPYDNISEGSAVTGIKVFGVKNIEELSLHLRGERLLVPIEPELYEVQTGRAAYDFASVVGQFTAKKACEIAAAGGHNLLFIGPPGTGKSMLAKCIPSILPDMTSDEITECSKIHSVSGKLSTGKPLITERPFVPVNQGISIAGLTGGGANSTPGAVSLAHNGVLFLDELPEFGPRTLESLRQPMEDGSITVSRVKRSVVYPSSFMLVCAMNPCPCGNFGNPFTRCTCSRGQVSNYLKRISGPLLDRIDLQVELQPVSVSDISSGIESESSESIRSRVMVARERQLKRFAGTAVKCNAKMSRDMIKECGISDAAMDALKAVYEAKNLSMRAYDKILKIARTAADLENCDTVTSGHIAQAVFFRSLDKKYWRGI